MSEESELSSEKLEYKIEKYFNSEEIRSLVLDANKKNLSRITIDLNKMRESEPVLTKMLLKNPLNKRGCAFLEFNTRKQTEIILNNFNGKIIHNLQLKFNRVRTLEEKYSAQKITKFTVSLDNY